MARLPIPGADEGQWGEILNEYLLQAHTSHGAVKPGSATNEAIAPGAISEAALAPNVQDKINTAADATGATGPAGVAGTSGASGAPGVGGAQGSAGNAGATGQQGAVGGPGATGATGDGGPAGASGIGGSVGAIGVTGPAGPANVVILDVNDPIPGTITNGTLYLRLTESIVDVRPPSVPANLSVGAVTATTIQLSWSASTDNIATTSYQLRLNSGSPISTADLTYTFTGLTTETQYSIQVRAGDAKGNWSAWSTAALATTDVSATIIWRDTFTRSDTSGLANIAQSGETWVAYDTDGAVIDAAIISNHFVPVRTNGSDSAYTRYTTTGNGDIPDDCVIDVVLPYERRHASYFGIVGRWDGTNGIRIFFDGEATINNLQMGNASNYGAGSESFTGRYSFPDSWDEAGDITLRIELSGAKVLVYADSTLIAYGTTSYNTGGVASGRAVGFCGEIDASTIPGNGLPLGAITVRSLDLAYQYTTLFSDGDMEFAQVIAEGWPAYTLGTEFIVDEPCELFTIRTWQGTANTPPAGGHEATVYRVIDGSNGTDMLPGAHVTIPGSTQNSIWISADLAAPIVLSPGTYRVAVSHPEGYFSAINDFFNGSGTVARGAISYPRRQSAIGQAQGNYFVGSMAFPATPAFANRNYCADVVVRTRAES